MSEAPERAGCDPTAEGMTAWINDYFTACNSGDVDRIADGEHDISDEAGWMPESSDRAVGVAPGIQLRE